MLSHVVLPRAKARRPMRPNTPTPPLVTAQHSKAERYAVEEITAKLVGGACMFGDGFFSQIGRSNVQAILKALNAEGIRVTGCDVGGYGGAIVGYGDRAW